METKRQYNKRIYILLSLIILNVILNNCSRSNQSTDGLEPKNVLFVVIDALRADHLGCYGYHRNTTPNLDRLAETGLRCSRAMVQGGWTKISFPSIFCSLYPSQHGIIHNLDKLPDGLVTMAEVFKHNGYVTYGLHDNQLIATCFNFNNGFDHYWRFDEDRAIDQAGFILLNGYLSHDQFDEKDLELLELFIENASFCNYISKDSVKINHSEVSRNGSEEARRDFDRYHVTAEMLGGEQKHTLAVAELDVGVHYLFGAFLETNCEKNHIKLEIAGTDNEWSQFSDVLLGGKERKLVLGHVVPTHEGETKLTVSFNLSLLESEMDCNFWLDHLFIVPYQYLPPFNVFQKQNSFIQLVIESIHLNKVDNGDFEQRLAGWKGNFDWSDEAFQGSQCFYKKQEADDAILNETILEQSLQLDPREPYIFGGFIRSRSNNPSIWFEIESDEKIFRSTTCKKNDDYELIFGICHLSNMSISENQHHSGSGVSGVTVKRQQIQFPPWSSIDPSVTATLTLKQSGMARGEEVWVDSIFVISTIDFPKAQLLKPDRQFIFLHIFNPHNPYTPPLLEQHIFSTDGIRLVDRYDGEIRTVDKKLGLLFEFLKNQNILDDTLIIITADHGEAFGEHKMWNHGPRQFFDEVARVPLIISNSRLFPAQKNVDFVVQSIDILPSLIDLMKLNHPPGSQFQGTSIFNLQRPATQYAFFYELDNVRAVSDHRWKYVTNVFYNISEACELWSESCENESISMTFITPRGKQTEQFNSLNDFKQSSSFLSLSHKNQGTAVKLFKNCRTREKLLFDLIQDPVEKNNLVVEYPKIAEKYQRIINQRIEDDRIYQQQPYYQKPSRREVDPKIRKQLEELGYL